MTSVRRLLLVLILATPAGFAEAQSNRFTLPAPDSCKTRTPVPTAVRGEDAVVDVPMPGDVIGAESAARLQHFVPPELWEHRERFFFDGMQMEIGPCYRDYAPPAFFRDVARVNGVHKAGWPNPAETLDPNAPDVALRWVENRAARYRGGGSFSKGRLSIVGPSGVLEQWRGDRFFVPLDGRADRADSDYRVDTKITARWAAGGVMRNLQTGGDCHFRQYGRFDGGFPDYFVGTSYGRKVSRETSLFDSVLNGCLVDANIGEGLFAWGSTAAKYEWKLRAVVDVLAPINLAKPVWPAGEGRGYGPWGVSFADDRWELRRAIVLEGAFREGHGADGTKRFVWYLDLQTLVPLYYAAWDEAGSSAGVGVYAHRWSEDRADYPKWTDDADRAVRVLDPMANAFVQWSAQHGVRWETGDSIAIPPNPKKLNRKMSASSIRIR